MRRRDLAAFVAAVVLAGAGVLTVPLGAQANEGPMPEQAQGPSSPPDPAPNDLPEPSTDPEPSKGPEPEPEPSAEPDPDPTDNPTDSVIEVDDAVFAWSMSEQTNARSHNPLAINFMSAGEANPGRGGIHLPKGKWKPSQGNVTVQKQTSAGRWRTATWEGLRTDAADKRIGVYGPFSGHRVQITGGTGTIDPRTDTAKLSWKGTWTVVYYSGNTVFTLTDPVLEVKKGKGELRAVGGGWAADRVDLDEWNPVASQVVPVVTFDKVDVTEKGLVVTPNYAGVTVEGSEPQKRTGDGWGSFPQELVTFLQPMGTDQFWYSTGLQSDWTKAPDPIQVGWQGVELKAPPPSPPPRQPEPTNPVTTAPPVIPAPVAQLPTVPRLAAAPPLPISAPLSAETPWQTLGATGAPVQVTASAPQGVRLASASTSVTPWVVGGVFLLGSALLLLVPVRGRATS